MVMWRGNGRTYNFSPQPRSSELDVLVVHISKLFLALVPCCCLAVCSSVRGERLSYSRRWWPRAIKRGRSLDELVHTKLRQLSHICEGDDCVASSSCKSTAQFCRCKSVWFPTLKTWRGLLGVDTNGEWSRASAIVLSSIRSLQLIVRYQNGLLMKMRQSKGHDVNSELFSGRRFLHYTTSESIRDRGTGTSSYSGCL